MTVPDRSDPVQEAAHEIAARALLEKTGYTEEAIDHAKQTNNWTWRRSIDVASFMLDRVKSPSPLPERGDVEELAKIILPATYASGSREERAEFSREIAGRVIEAGWTCAPDLKAALEEIEKAFSIAYILQGIDPEGSESILKARAALARAGGK